MNRLLTPLGLLTALAFAAPIMAQTAVPGSMNFQGRLARPDGTPVADNAAQPVTFRLFSAASGGTALWSQTSTVTVRNGAFAVALDFAAGFSGSNTFASLFASSPYLEIQVGGNTPLTPRQIFRSVPYAFTANTALTVPDGSITVSKLANGVLNFANIGGTVATSQFATGTIPSTALIGDPLAALSKFSAGPSLLSSIATGANPNSIAVSGNYAYVADTGAGAVEIYNVTNPAQPVHLTTLGYSTGVVYNAPALAVSGNYLYVVGYTSSISYLTIFDVTNPAAPTSLASINLGSGAPQSIAVAGNLACIVSSTSNLLTVVNVTNPAMPVLAGSIALGAKPSYVAAAGNFAYVSAYSNSRLRIYNVSPSSAPTLAGFVSTGGGPVQLLVSGNIVYLVANTAGLLQTFNVSNPAAPTLLGSVSTGAYPNGLALSGTNLYVNAAGSNTLLTFNVNNPTAPVLTQTTPTGNGPDGIAIAGNYAYLTSFYSNQMQIFDLNGASVSNLQVSGNLSVGSLYGINDLVRVFGGLEIDERNENAGSLNPGGIRFGKNSGEGIASNRQTGGVNAFGLDFYTSSTNRMSISGSGAVTVNGSLTVTTTDNSAALTGTSANGYGVSGSGGSRGVIGDSYDGYGVLGTSTGNDGVHGVSTSGTGGFFSGGSVGVYSTSSGTGGFFSGGGVGVYGTSDNSDGVRGNSYNGTGGRFYGAVYGIYSASGNTGYAGYFDGNVIYTGSLTHSSDIRYKTHIATLPNALDDILSLRGVSYDWDRAKWPEKNFSDGKQIGFIAQEIEKIFPELVSTDKDGYKSVNYISVVPVAVEAIKTLNAKLDDKQKQLDTQKREIDELKFSNAELKAQRKEIDALKKQNAEIVTLLKKLQEEKNK